MPWSSAERKRQYYLRHPGRQRANTRKHKYGITAADFSALLASQAGRCAICRVDSPGKRDWHVDHDHETKKVRGLLCGRCNPGLGHFLDDPLRLELAAAYLRRWGK